MSRRGLDASRVWLDPGGFGGGSRWRDKKMRYQLVNLIERGNERDRKALERRDQSDGDAMRWSDR